MDQLTRELQEARANAETREEQLQAVEKERDFLEGELDLMHQYLKRLQVIKDAINQDSEASLEAALANTTAAHGESRTISQPAACLYCAGDLLIGHTFSQREV